MSEHDTDFWVTKEEFALLNQAKKSLGGGEAQSVDEHLSALKSAGDEDGYDKAYEAALKTAIKSGDMDEFDRISNEIRPFDAEPVATPDTGPSKATLGKISEVFTNPAYEKAMMATKGDPAKVAKVYDDFDVPEEGRMDWSDDHLAPASRR